MEPHPNSPGLQGLAEIPIDRGRQAAIADCENHKLLSVENLWKERGRLGIRTAEETLLKRPSFETLPASEAPSDPNLESANTRSLPVSFLERQVCSSIDENLKLHSLPFFLICAVSVVNVSWCSGDTTWRVVFYVHMEFVFLEHKENTGLQKCLRQLRLPSVMF